MSSSPLHVISSASQAAPVRSFTDSAPLLGDPSALQNRAERDGYLFFRGLLAPEEVFKLRADMLVVIDHHGWRQPGQDALGGLVDVQIINQVPEEEMRLDIGVSAAAYDDVQKLERLHRLPHHPRLLALYRDLFGGREVLVHPRHIARMTTPHRSMIPTPPSRLPADPGHSRHLDMLASCWCLPPRTRWSYGATRLPQVRLRPYQAGGRGGVNRGAAMRL